MATKTTILDALASAVASYPSDPSESLNDTQKTELCDQLAEVLETLNPNHNYPPTVKA